MGGVRDVPVPDPIARDYLLLAMRLDRHVPGTVDGYFGPADLKARVDMDPLRPPARLAEDAADLQFRLAGEVLEPDRRHWLELQLVALETLARVCSGEPLGYLDQVTRCLAMTPRRRPPDQFEEAAARLDALLPGRGDLAERLVSEDEAWTVPAERVPAVAEALVARFRAQAARQFGLPPGETVRLATVRDQPWSGYNWYEGGYRSRVDLNLDLPIRLPGLIGTIAHETYPGHHLEHAAKEQALVEGLGRLEAAILLINTPECLISEGMANVGRELAVLPAEREGLLVDLAHLAGVPVAADAGALFAAASRQASIAEQRSILNEARVNAALMLHEDLRPRDEVLEYLVAVGRVSPEGAAKRLEFLEHPLWRTYVFAYPEGEALLQRWLDAVPREQRPARFGRLLREPLTPPAIEAEIAQG
jgi:hypothetical protein